MMNLCSHARKDELADARRLMADLTETSSMLSTQGKIGVTGAIVFVFDVLVIGVMVLSDRSNVDSPRSTPT
jgi:hypothetical protein